MSVVSASLALRTGLCVPSTAALYAGLENPEQSFLVYLFRGNQVACANSDDWVIRSSSRPWELGHPSNCVNTSVS